MSSKEEAIRDQATMERRCRGPAQRVTVLYYLCRNGRHLEHPHLMELTLTSPNHALYLRDVIHRLDALRGKGMAAMYSWSCKRRYKTGFVWHDVSEHDVLLPAQGSSEYVLKGSLLLNRHTPPPAAAVSDQEQQSVDATIIPKIQWGKPIIDEESPAHSRGSQQANSSSSSPPPLPQKLQQPQQALSSISPTSSSTTKDSDQEAARSSSSGSSSSTNKSTNRGPGGSTPSSSGSGCSPSSPPSLMPNNKEHNSVQSSIIAGQDTAEHNNGVSTGRKLQRTKYASGSRSGTLESLIRAEAIVRRGGCGSTSKRILLEDDESSLVDDKDAVHSLGGRFKPANLLMRLLSCGSTMPMRHHPACGFMCMTHKPQPMSHNLEPPPPSPVLSPLGALIMRPETTEIRVVSEPGDSGNCSCRWSMPQTVGKGEELGKGMSNSSHDPHRVSKNEASDGSSNLESISRIVPQIMRMAPSEQSTRETFETITTDTRHNSAEHECGNEPPSTTLSRCKSTRMSDPSEEKTRCSKLVSFHDEKQKVVKFEERLASGARITIQRAPLLSETYVRANAM